MLTLPDMSLTRHDPQVPERQALSMKTPASSAASRMGKWTVKVMYFLMKGPQRHGQLRRGLGNVSQRMLTRTLRNLEFSGLIARQVTRSKSLVVEYSLTKLGRTFIVPLDSSCRWADGNKKELSAVVRLRDKQR